MILKSNREDKREIIFKVIIIWLIGSFLLVKIDIRR